VDGWWEGHRKKCHEAHSKVQLSQWDTEQQSRQRTSLQ
jgi:hypothetical protein